MENNWRKNLGRGDVSRACRETGVSTTVYYDSIKVPKEEWTTAQIRVNARLMEMAEETAQAREKVMSTESV